MLEWRRIPVEDHPLYSFLEQVVADHMTWDVKIVTRSIKLRELGALLNETISMLTRSWKMGKSWGSYQNSTTCPPSSSPQRT